MEIIKPSVKLITELNDQTCAEIMQKIESAGRVCYKSEAKNPDLDPEITDGFVGRILGRQHTSVIEHHSLTAKFICDRGVTHEMVRHRLCSFSQESTRYVNYNKKGMQFILPPWCDERLLGEHKPNWKDQIVIDVGDDGEKLSDGDVLWLRSVWNAKDNYNALLEQGWKPEMARSVLPNSLKTEIVVTANLRQWREVLIQRTAKAAHPQIREVMIPLLETLARKLPVIFGDIYQKLQEKELTQ